MNEHGYRRVAPRGTVRCCVALRRQMRCERNLKTSLTGQRVIEPQAKVIDEWMGLGLGVAASASFTRS